MDELDTSTLVIPADAVDLDKINSNFAVENCVCILKIQ